MAKITEVVIDYSYAIRANIANYESAQVTIGKTEKWDVSGMTPEEVAKLWDERFAAIKEEIDTRVEGEYDNVSVYGKGE